MPPKKRYLAYFEPGTSSSKVPRQTVWSQRQRQSACGEDSEEAGDEGHDPIPTSHPDLNDDLSLHLESSMPNTQPLVPDEEAVVLEDPDEDLSEFIRINSESTLPNQETTRLQAMLLVLTFVSAAGLPWTQVDSLLKLLNALLGQNIFPSTKYGLRKLWDLHQTKMVGIHTYCPTCLCLTSGCGLDLQHCSTCATTITAAQLIKKGSFFLTVDLKCQLQRLLKNFGDIVGRNLLKLAAATHEGTYKDITDGQLYRKIRCERNMSWSDLTVTANSDGAPVFKSSKGSMWPIQVQLNELPLPYRWKNILIGAIWFAKEHPPAHVYLKAFVDNINAIGSFSWSFAGQVVLSTVNVLCFCVDSPARASLLNAKQYNGYYGCSWCLQKGTLVNGTLKYIMEGHGMVERCHDSVLDAMHLAATRNCPVDGLKGLSPVSNLRTLDLVWGFPPDYMHCVLEGVTAQLMELWLCTSGSVWYIGNRIREVNNRLLKIRPPIFFTRLPRPVTERSFWKATEWKYWLLYYSLPCLHNLLPQRYFAHFCFLSHSLYILLKTVVEEREICFAERLLKQFVEQMPVLYGEHTLTFNVHQLVHLAKSVRMTGPLWATSTFPFEGGNGDILKLVSAAKGVPHQITERFIMREVLKSLKRLVALPPFLNRQQKLISGRQGYKNQSGVLGAPLHCGSLESHIQDLITQAIGAVSGVTEYLRARVSGITVHSVSYTRTKKTCSQYIETDDGKFLRVLRIFLVQNNVLLLCQKLITEESFIPFMFIVEHPPTEVGLCIIKEKKVKSPCVLVAQNDQSYIAKVPNLYEID